MSVMSSFSVKVQSYFSRLRFFLDANPHIRGFFFIIALVLFLPIAVGAALTFQNLQQKASGNENLKILDVTTEAPITQTSDVNVKLQITLPSDWALPSPQSTQRESLDGIASLVRKAYASHHGPDFIFSGADCTNENVATACDSSHQWCWDGACHVTICPYPNTSGQFSCSSNSQCASGWCNAECCSAPPAIPPTATQVPTQIPTATTVSPTQTPIPTRQPLIPSATLPPQVPTATTQPGQPTATSAPVVHILSSITIENKDIDGSSGGTSLPPITSNFTQYLATPVQWKLNGLNPDQSQATRTVQVTLFDGTSYVPFKATITLLPAGANVSPLPATDTIHISSCQEITKPGNYVLDNDLIGASGSINCLNIHNTKDINLDCNGHMITVDVPANQTKAIGPLLEIKNVSNFSVKSCNVSVLLKSSKMPVRPFSLINTSHGVLIDNIIGFYQVDIINSSEIQIKNNNFNSALDVIDSNNIIIQGNSLINQLTSDQTPDKEVAGVISLSGNNITVEDNIIDGGSDGIYYTDVSKRNGADDGIYIVSATTGLTEKLIIKNNTISNNWDCGIETVGLVKSMIISGNKIKNSGVCGIGAWYGNSWIGNTVNNNLIEDSPKMFYFFRARKLEPEEVYVYFTDNVFTGNRLLSQRKENGGYYSEPAIIYMIKETRDLIPTDKFIVSNNIFTNNDFNKNSPITLGPPFSGILDGGGNICAPSFVDDFPLKCIDNSSSISKFTVQPKPPPCFGKYNNTTFGYGDIDGDGVLTQKDYDLLRTGSASFTPDQQARALLDGNTTLTPSDLGLLGEYLGGKITIFPVCRKGN